MRVHILTSAHGDKCLSIIVLVYSETVSGINNGVNLVLDTLIVPRHETRLDRVHRSVYSYDIRDNLSTKDKRHASQCLLFGGSTVH